MEKHSQMLDLQGRPVIVGCRCKFWAATRDMWVVGTVRRIQIHSYYRSFENREDVWEALVDDGNPENSDFHENGFHVSAWVESAGIEVLND